MHSKECRKCHIIKPISNFDKDKTKSDGYRNQCKTCISFYHKNRHKIIKELYTCSICKLKKQRIEFRYNPISGLKTECKECEKTQLRCSKCNEIKKHEEFQNNKIAITGKQSWCIKCDNIHRKERFQNDIKFREKRKIYYRSDAVREKRKAYYARPDVKAKSLERQRENQTKRYRDPINHSKALARLSVAKAVKSGSLIKPSTCQANEKYSNKCTSTPVVGHHHLGYAEINWLDVEWLCPTCHKVANHQQYDNPEAISKPPEVDFQAIVDLYNNQCAYCGYNFNNSNIINDPNELTEDHIIPRSKDGEHTFDNIVPSCRSCNVKKFNEILKKPLPGKPISVEELLKEAFPERYIEKPNKSICSVCQIEKDLFQTNFRFDLRFGFRTECLECEKTILRCSKCKKVKFHDAFSPDNIMSTGRKSNCRVCNQDHQKIVRKTDDYRKKRSIYRDLDHVKETTAEYNRNYNPKKHIIVTEKLCSKCKEIKPSEMFGPNKKTSTGLASWCKSCVAIKVSEQRMIISFSTI